MGSTLTVLNFITRRLLTIDPEYALAYSGLANRYIFFKLPSQLEGISIAKMYAS